MTPEDTKSAEWEAAEKAFGCAFASFARIHAGESSRNYRAETPDGRKYFVKFAPPGHVKKILERLGAISSPLIPGLAFNGATGTLGDKAICAIEWSEGGVNIPPHLLTKRQIKSIREGYEEISRGLSSVDPRLLKPRGRVEEAAKECGLAVVPIHGDFHYMNYFMRDGAVSSCFDIESMRLGIPTEDLLRIFAHAIERTRLWNVGRLDAIYRNLTEMVRVSSFSKDAWLAAVRLYIDHKTGRRVEKSAFPLLMKIGNWLRSPYYRRMRRAVEEA